MSTIPARQRAKATNNPLAGLNLQTSTGRRVRDLYQGIMAKLDLDDIAIRSAVRRAADLQVLSEQQRARMLNDNPTPSSEGIGAPSDTETPCVACQSRQARHEEQESLIRLENMTARSMREIADLLTAIPKPPESHQEFIRKLNNELFDEGDDCDRGETEEEDSAATD